MQSAPSADTADGRSRPSSFRRLGVPAVALSLALGAAQLAAAAPSQAATGGPATRVAVGKAPTLPKGTVAATAPSSSSKLSLDVELNTGKTAELEAYASAVADRNSPYYHDYLTSAQVAQDFGASTTEIDAVEAQLSSDGLSGASVMGNGMFVHVTATVAQAEKAFGVSIKGYTAAGHGFFANSTAPTISSSIASDVSGLVGLDNISYAVPEYVSSGHTVKATASQLKNNAVSPHSAVGSCSNIVDTYNAVGLTDGTDYYTDDQVASIYGMTGVPSSGAGVTVAVVEFEPYDPTGVNDLYSCYGGSHGGFSETAVDGGPSGSANMFDNVGVESALDIENIGILAPGASIINYAGPDASQLSDSQWLDTFDAAISGPAKVISDSWGECEAVDDSTAEQGENTLFASAATEGKTVLAASGDSGSSDCYGEPFDATTISVDDPASQPFVTGVGGTTMTALSSPTQSVWNWTIASQGKTYAGASGGGLSSVWGLPSYQQGVQGPGYSTYCATAATTGCRQVPDVSALGDPNDGYVIDEYYNDNQGNSGEYYNIIGGTSGAAPVWAAIIAQADTSSACTTNGAAGFINPALYAAGGSMAKYSVFRDITKGNNFNSFLAGGSGHGYSSAAGYDMASGWGTPQAPGVISAVCQAPVVSPASYYTPVTPNRILNTRTNTGAKGPVAANGTISFGLGSSVSGNVSAAVINLTVTNPAAYGYATMYPDGSALPTSSNVNWTKSQTLPNLVVVPVGADGKVDIHNSSTGTAQFVGDLMGYFTTSSAGASTYTAVGPIRAMDTRHGIGVSQKPIAQGSPESLQVGATTLTSGSQNVTIPAGISAVAMNVTVTNPTKAGFLTVYPNETSAGSPVATPGTSNLNFPANLTIPNMVIVPVGADGKVDFAVGGNTGGASNVIADISGYFMPGTSGQVYHALGPDRVLDTRKALGTSSTTPMAAGGTLALPIPSTATAVIANLTATNPSTIGFVTAYPIGSTLPSSSNVNYGAEQTVANLAIIPSNSGIDFNNNSKGTTNLVADLAGYFSAS